MRIKVIETGICRGVNFVEYKNAKSLENLIGKMQFEITSNIVPIVNIIDEKTIEISYKKLI